MPRYSSTINTTLSNGETERWVIETDGMDAVRVDLEADAAPYDVDLAVSQSHNGQRQFDQTDYTSVLPLGPETYTDTGGHVTATDTVDASLYVEITNNSGVTATFTGAINTHGTDASSTAQEFVTAGTGQRASAYRDGRALANNETLDTVEVSAEYQSTQGLSAHASQNIQNGREIPLPTFERYDNNPLWTLSDVPGLTTSDDLLWPSPITTGQIDGPDAEIYVFFGSHDVNGYWLAKSDSITGSYEQEGSVISSDREGSVFYNSDDGQLWAYRNTQNQDIRRYTSSDGKSWTQQEVVVSSGGHAGIPWPVQGPRGYYLISNFGFNDDSRKPVLHHSDDGINDFGRVMLHWEGRRLPTGYNTDGTVSNTFLNVTMTPYLNGYLVFYQDRHLLDSGTYDIRMGYTETGNRIKDLGVALDSNGSDAQAWEDEQLATPAPFWYDGDLWLFYSAGSGSTSQEGIGLAKADFGTRRVN